MSQPLRAFVGMLDRYKWKYLLAALLLILSIGFRSFEPKILQLAVDHVVVLPFQELTPDDRPDDVVSRMFYALLPELTVENVTILLAMLAFFYFTLALLRGGLLFISDAIKAWCSEKVAKQIRDTSFAHIQRLPMQYFTGVTRGELIHRCTGDIDTIRNFMKSQIIAVVRIVSLFVFAFTMMAISDWQYALVCVAVAPFFVVSAYLFFNKERKVWRLHEAESDKLTDLVQENLNGIRVVSAFANEAHEIERFEKQNLDKRKMGFRHNLLHTVFWPLTDMLGFAQLVVSMIVGGYFTVSGRITVGELLSFYTYMGMVAWPMRDLGRVLSEMGMAMVAMDRMSEILKAARESLQGKKVSRLSGEIEFRNVGFRYRKTDEFVIRHVSFKIPAGASLAVIGPTGAGKSTLIKLLLRLYDPEEGEILLDGQPIQQFSRESVREKIGLALQRPFLFSTTIRTNIAYTQPDIELAKVEEAARQSQFHEVEEVFPHGYDTMVGEKGVTLSGGQKQRVALARTLLSEPDILILDDITSAVDTETEQAIFEALAGPMAGKTTLIVSHRITSIQQAERILVMENGRVVQAGTPAELAGEEGYYKEILEVQSAVESEIKFM